MVPLPIMKLRCVLTVCSAAHDVLLLPAAGMSNAQMLSQQCIAWLGACNDARSYQSLVLESESRA